MGLFQALFTWWNGATMGTRLFTAWRGRLLGEDAEGNCYFEERRAAPGRAKRRWVVYKGLAEASKVPADWHGWLHHTFEAPPTAEPFKVKAWEKPHVPNLSGTPFAWRPPGSLWHGGRRPKATGDYQPWTPDGG
jgi:NADH:ubiquinone oxidoreductase subunit